MTVLIPILVAFDAEDSVLDQRVLKELKGVGVSGRLGIFGGPNDLSRQQCADGLLTICELLGCSVYVPGIKRAKFGAVPDVLRSFPFPYF